MTTDQKQLSSDSASTNGAPFLCITDEYCAIMALSQRDDDIREILRELPGVPNAVYAVDGDRVFVFEKLLSLVKNNPDFFGLDNKARHDVVHTLLPDAYVSPIQAIKEWRVSPEPYSFTSESQGFVIRHQSFNAIIPGFIATRDDLDNALATLLVGGVIDVPGGDFSYRGQSMILCEGFDLANIPSEPWIFEPEPFDSRNTCFSGVKFNNGFSPISRELFNQIKEIDVVWRNKSDNAVKRADKESESIWKIAGNLPLASLNSDHHEVDEDDLDVVTDLRACYPELSMLGDSSLYFWYDQFNKDGGCWDVYRENAFLFFLIGNLISNAYCAIQIMNGRLTAYAWLRGCAIEEALEFGRQCAKYDLFVRSIARRAVDAMRFLAEDEAKLSLQGHPVTTLNDLFRIGRKSNIAPIVLSSSESQLVQNIEQQ